MKETQEWVNYPTWKVLHQHTNTCNPQLGWCGPLPRVWEALSVEQHSTCSDQPLSSSAHLHTGAFTAFLRSWSYEGPGVADFAERHDRSHTWTVRGDAELGVVENITELLFSVLGGNLLSSLCSSGGPNTLIPQGEEDSWFLVPYSVFPCQFCIPVLCTHSLGWSRLLTFIFQNIVEKTHNVLDYF